MRIEKEVGQIRAATNNNCHAEQPNEEKKDDY